MSTSHTGQGMPDPMAQVEVESEIRRLVQELTSQTVAVAEAARESAEADARYDIGYAKALLEIPKVLDGEKVTVAEREARALVKVEVYYEDRKLTEAVYRVEQERGRNLRAMIDALRTIAANVRDAVQHGY